MFFPLVKADQANRLVYARAAVEEPDKSREIMDYVTAVPQFQKWSDGFKEATLGKSLGNIRAMHDPRHLAGVVKSIEFNDEAKSVDVCFKVLDPVDWHKVEEGGYTGLSIGGGYLKKWKDAGDPTLTRYTPRLAEISLVDSPCIPSARIMELQKQDGTTEEVLLKGVMPPTFADLLPPPTFGELLEKAAFGEFVSRLGPKVKAAGKTLGYVQQGIGHVKTARDVAGFVGGVGALGGGVTALTHRKKKPDPEATKAEAIGELLKARKKHSLMQARLSGFGAGLGSGVGSTVALGAALRRGRMPTLGPMLAGGLGGAAAGGVAGHVAGGSIARSRGARDRKVSEERATQAAVRAQALGGPVGVLAGGGYLAHRAGLLGPMSRQARRAAERSVRRGAARVASATLPVRQRTPHLEPEIAARMGQRTTAGHASALRSLALRAARAARFVKQEEAGEMEKASLNSPEGREKIRQTMHEFKHGTLRSFRSNLPKKKMPKVTDRKQAIAIALSQARREMGKQEDLEKGIVLGLTGAYLGSRLGGFMGARSGLKAFARGATGPEAIARRATAGYVAGGAAGGLAGLSTNVRMRVHRKNTNETVGKMEKAIPPIGIGLLAHMRPIDYAATAALGGATGAAVGLARGRRPAPKWKHPILHHAFWGAVAGQPVSYGAYRLGRALVSRSDEKLAGAAAAGHAVGGPAGAAVAAVKQHKRQEHGIGKSAYTDLIDGLDGLQKFSAGTRHAMGEGAKAGAVLGTVGGLLAHPTGVLAGPGALAGAAVGAGVGGALHTIGQRLADRRAILSGRALSDKEHQQRIAAAKARWAKEGGWGDPYGHDAAIAAAKKAVLGRDRKVAAAQARHDKQWSEVADMHAAYDAVKPHMKRGAKVGIIGDSGSIYDPDDTHNPNNFNMHGLALHEMYLLAPSEVPGWIAKHGKGAKAVAKLEAPGGRLTKIQLLNAPIQIEAA